MNPARPARTAGRRVDLHAHTFFSDGQLSPEELVQLALGRDLVALGRLPHGANLSRPLKSEDAEAIQREANETMDEAQGLKSRLYQQAEADRKALDDERLKVCDAAWWSLPRRPPGY